MEKSESRLLYIVFGALLALLVVGLVFFVNIRVPNHPYYDIQGRFCKEAAYMVPEECHLMEFGADTLFKQIVPTCPNYVVVSRENDTIFPTFFLEKGSCHFRYFDTP